MHSPTHLFIIPGLVLRALGTIITLLVARGAPRASGTRCDEHTMIAGSLLMVVGTQTIGLGVCARAYGYFLMGERDPCSTASGCASSSRTSCSRAWR